MYKRIENSAAYVRFLQRYRQHNDACVQQQHTRRVKQPDGSFSIVKYQRRTGLLPEQLKTTFYVILQEYVKNYNEVVVSAPEGGALPSLLTNNVRLAELCDCTDRTIRNHVRTLASLKLIQTKFRGREHNFELWISSEILWEGSENKNLKTSSKSATSPPLLKSFPPSNTDRKIIENEKGKDNVLKCGHGENIEGQRGWTDQPSSVTEPSEPHTERRRLGGGGGPVDEFEGFTEEIRNIRADRVQAKLPQLPARLEKYFGEMLMQFWMYAWKVLYTNRDFSKEQQEAALLAIYTAVYGKFDTPRNSSQWADFHARQLEKIDKVARYFDNHPDAYLPDPYAVHVKGRGYFDAENTRGFAGVEAWIQKDEVLATKRQRAYEEERDKKRKRGETLLRQARRDFEKFRAEQPLRKELTGKDLTGVWNYYRLIFSGLGKKWEAKFMTQFLEQQANDFQPPVYYKPKRQRQLAKGQIEVNVEDWMTYSEGYYSEL